MTATGYQDRTCRLNSIGFVKQLFEESAYCFEADPAKLSAQAALTLFASDPRFAVYDPREIIGCSVGGSHTNHAVLAVEQGRPCSLEEISTDGKLDKSMFYKYPDFIHVA